MSKIKEILCLHHSHLDVGYTHPQSMLLELQCDYIEQAIDLCLATEGWPEESRFRWTCEANYPVMKWMESAQPKRLEVFRRLVREGRISVTAMPMHTTPGCTTQQLVQYFQQLQRIRELTGSSIRTAINHDVNGQPWTMAALLLDSNVEFYLTGINIHFGGIPFPRPYVFCWDTQDGRSLPVMLGEHYSLFSQFMFTNEGSVARMHEGVQEYVSRIEETGWQEDYVYLTATNPPLYDNNCPDFLLADLIRRYNEEGHEQKIRFVTPEMLYERICKKGLDRLPHHSGDWTDYWNFGSASTPAELRVNRLAKNNLAAADFLNVMYPETRTDRTASLINKAYECATLFDEHTWGSSESVVQPDQEDTRVQLNHKREAAYTAADLSAYLLGRGMEEAAGNPYQAEGVEGLLIVNPTPFEVHQEIYVPSDMLRPGRTLAALRMKEYLPYVKKQQDKSRVGIVDMKPFSAKRIPFRVLQEQTETDAALRISENKIETPFYRVEVELSSGRILEIFDKVLGKNIIDMNSSRGFFEMVEESVDPSFGGPLRHAFFGRDVEKGNKNISQWNHDWKAVRQSAEKSGEIRIEKEGSCAVLYRYYRSRNVERLEQRISFSALHPRIGLELSMEKKGCIDPDGIYFTFPLSLEKGWECCYDTADTMVKLDEEQLGNVCRDYLTVDRSISLYDSCWGCTLACPDAPMVQVGDFQFGKENHQILRHENPLLLAWPMNNYWETNFAASQEGALSFYYEFSTFGEFDALKAHEAGVLAASPLMAGAAVECREEAERIFLRCEGRNVIPLFIRPQCRKAGMLAAVKNYAAEENSCRLSFPGRQITFAAVTDIQGNVRKQLEISGEGVDISLPAYGIVFVGLGM